MVKELEWPGRQAAYRRQEEGWQRRNGKPKRYASPPTSPSAAAASRDGGFAVTIHAEGACLGALGAAGYAAVLLYQGHRREVVGGLAKAARGRAELLSAIRAIEALRKPCAVTLYSSSRYLIGRFQPVDLRLARGAPSQATVRSQDRDLWARLSILRRRHQVTFRWVADVADQPESQRCFNLAMRAAIEAQAGSGGLARVAG